MKPKKSINPKTKLSYRVRVGWCFVPSNAGDRPGPSTAVADYRGNKGGVRRGCSGFCSGFTLVELLIVMAVVAIMSVMAYSGLKILLKAKAVTASKSERLAQLQMTLHLLNEDLSQIAERPVRDEYGLSEPAFKSDADGDLLTLTRTVPVWTARQTGSRLQRVSYRVEQGALYRQVWDMLDRTQQSQIHRRKLMAVENIQVRFFDTNWLDHWSSQALPNAVECVLNIREWGPITRLFYLHKR